jgi:hypothetical protein
MRMRNNDYGCERLLREKNRRSLFVLLAVELRRKMGHGISWTHRNNDEIVKVKVSGEEREKQSENICGFFCFCFTPTDTEAY